MIETKGLPLGMTKSPLGWPLMGDAFLSFVSFALRSDEIKEQYLKDEGVDLKQFENQSPIDKIIDDKTGYAKEVFALFLDWLVVNYWGEENEV